MKCDYCGRSWYRSLAPTAGCAVVEAGRALVTIRGIDPHKGQIDVPGGFLRPGEDPIDALKREVHEELGISIDVFLDDCLSMATHTYGDDGDFVLALGFAARLVGGDPSPRDDVADFRWVTPAELDDLDFAWPHDKELVRKALAREGERHGSG